MDCRKAEQFLSFYVYDELEDMEKTRVDAHLQICGKCTRELENFKVVRSALAELPPAEAPDDFLIGVRARLEQPETFLERLGDVLAPFSPARMAAGGSVAMAASFAFMMTHQAPMAMNQAVAPQQEVSATQALAEKGSAGMVVGEVEGLQESLFGSGGAVVAPVAARAEVSVEEDAADEEAPMTVASAAGVGTSAGLSGAPLPGTSAAPATEAASIGRRDAAESFDDVFGEPPKKERKISDRDRAPAPDPAPVPAPVVASRPVELQLASAARRALSVGPAKAKAKAVAKNFLPKPAALPKPSARKRSTGPAPSPFLEARANTVLAKIAPPKRDLSQMNGRELANELDSLAPEVARPRRSRAVAQPSDGVSIFSPSNEAGGELLARVASEPEMSDHRTVSPFDGGNAGYSDSSVGFLAPSVSLGWVRTTFGRAVTVREATDPLPPMIHTRELSIRTSDGRTFLSKVHALLEAGRRIELKQVDFERGHEVAVLVSYPRSPAGEQEMNQFVENLRTFPGSEVASDLVRENGSGLQLITRIVLPNSGR